MNLRQLQHFATLMETRNFHRAAELLHMTQPPLSVSIKRLEDELGEKLFERTSTGLLPTPMAIAMLADARSALFHAEQCKLKFQESHQGLGGLMRVGFIGTATYRLLPLLIPQLRKDYPRMELELMEMTSLEILGGLSSQNLDLGFLRFPVLDSVGLDIFPLERDDFVLAVSTNSPLAKSPGQRIALSEAAKENYIVYPKSRVPSLSAMAHMRCQVSGFTPNVVQEAMQVQTILSLVASDIGVALVAGVAKQHPMHGVVCLELSDTPAEFCIGLAVAAVRHQRHNLTKNVLQNVLKHHQTPEMYARQTAG